MFNSCLRKKLQMSRLERSSIQQQLMVRVWSHQRAKAKRVHLRFHQLHPVQKPTKTQRAKLRTFRHQQKTKLQTQILNLRLQRQIVKTKPKPIKNQKHVKSTFTPFNSKAEASPLTCSWSYLYSSSELGSALKVKLKHSTPKIRSQSIITKQLHITTTLPSTAVDSSAAA